MPGMENMAVWQYVSLAFLSSKPWLTQSPGSTLRGKGLLWEQEQVAVQWWFFLLWTSQNWTEFVFLLPSAGQDIAFGLNKSASKTAANYSLTWSWLLLCRTAVRADESFRNKNSIREPLPPLRLPLCWSHGSLLHGLWCGLHRTCCSSPRASWSSWESWCRGCTLLVLPAPPLCTVPWQEAAHSARPFSHVLEWGFAFCITYVTHSWV